MKCNLLVVVLAGIGLLTGIRMVDAEGITVRPSGTSDQSRSVQKALDRCASTGGGTVLLKVGKYRLDGPLIVPSGVTLAGEWAGPHHAQLDKGTIIFAHAGKGRENDPPLIKLSPSSTLKGITVYYPEQTLPGVLAYPWTVRGEGAHCSVVDVTLVNCYKGIDFGTRPNSFHLARNVYGCTLKTGVYIDRCTGGGRIENVHFNHHYWVRAVDVDKSFWDPFFSYSYLNTSAFEIGSARHEMMLNTFTIACKIGYRFFAGRDGACSGSFLNINADYSQFPMLIEQTQAPGLLITNGQFVGGNATHDESTVTVRPTHKGIVQFVNGAFWGPAIRIADISGDGDVSFQQCNFVRFKWEDRTGPVIIQRGGHLSVQGCVFHPKWDEIVLEKGAKSARIDGNTFSTPLKLINNGGTQVQTLGNATR